MTDQDSPLWERLGMEYDLSPPWTSFNMVDGTQYWDTNSIMYP